MINFINTWQIQEYVKQNKPFISTVNRDFATECIKYDLTRTTREEFKEYLEKYEEYYCLKFANIVRQAKIIKCEQHIKINKKDPNFWSFLTNNDELIYMCKRKSEDNAWKEFIKNIWYDESFKDVRIGVYLLMYDLYNTQQEQEPNEQSDNQLGETQSATEQSELQA